ncbi:MAG: MotA/TolQ/ExbB proton channel family protein [Kiritimatiellia bacterium]|jgi:biopolymer transport protein ExbB
MKLKPVSVVAVAALLACAAPVAAFAQEEAPAAEEAQEAGTLEVAESQPEPQSGTFSQVIFGSGAFGAILWFALFGVAAASVYFIVDSIILVRPQKIMPQALIDKVIAAMAEGDVLKAIKACESEPGPMANILSAGFSHVEEGYDIIQEAIATAADLEIERLMQRMNWISVCANISPMLGLLGTVQGMIMAFATLATGAPDVGSLALAISQALWTTAAGLCVAIPSVTAYYAIRNNANRIILRMQAITLELIKDLRNVEIVES